MSSSRIPYLVIGADGMLGTDFVLKLGDQCQTVIGPQYRVKKPTDRVIDITVRELVIDIVKQYRPKIVINAAAYTDVDACEKNVDQAMGVNGTAVGYIAEACNVVGAKLVHISTDYVFDGRKGTPYVETDGTNPLSIYGKSKLEGEIQARKAKDCLIVRTAWLYGIYGKNFITVIVKKALDDGQLFVVDDQIGSPTYTLDLIEGILKLLKKDERGIFHLTNTGACSWFEYAQKIIEHAGIKEVNVQPIKTAESYRPAPRPQFSVLNIAKYEKAASHKMRKWEDALKDFVLTHKDKLLQ